MLRRARWENIVTKLLHSLCIVHCLHLMLQNSWAWLHRATELFETRHDYPMTGHAECACFLHMLNAHQTTICHLQLVIHARHSKVCGPCDCSLQHQFRSTCMSTPACSTRLLMCGWPDNICHMLCSMSYLLQARSHQAPYSWMQNWWTCTATADTTGIPPLSLQPVITIMFVVAPKPYAPRP